MLKLIFVFLSFLFCLSVKSQDTSSFKKDVDIKALPIVYFTPETNFAFGFAGITTLRLSEKQTQPSVLQFAGAYTLRKQLILTNTFDLFLKGDIYRLVGELSYYHYNFNFYGLGRNSLKSNFEKYEANYPKAKVTLYRKLAKNIKIGGVYNFINMNSIKYKENGVFDREILSHKNGGTVSDLGVGFLFDSRSSVVYPTKGYFIESQYLRSSYLLGSDFNFSRITLDARAFYKISDKGTLGFQGYFGQNFGDVPFFELFNIGNAYKMRGLNDRRFADNAVGLLQSEYRHDLHPRWNLSVFSSIGAVDKNLSNLMKDKIEATYGLGIRYVLSKKEKTLVRADFARHKEGFNFYLTTNNAF